MPRLKNWSIRDGGYYGAYFALFNPEDKNRISGDIYNDEKLRFEDGEKITTSLINEIDFKNKVAQTLYTKYELGEVDSEYIKWLVENGYNTDDFIKKVSE